MTNGTSKWYTRCTFVRGILTKKTQHFILNNNRENHISLKVLRTVGQTANQSKTERIIAANCI